MHDLKKPVQIKFVSLTKIDNLLHKSHISYNTLNNINNIILNGGKTV